MNTIYVTKELSNVCSQEGLRQFQEVHRQPSTTLIWTRWG